LKTPNLNTSLDAASIAAWTATWNATTNQNIIPYNPVTTACINPSSSIENPKPLYNLIIKIIYKLECKHESKYYSIQSLI
jgi:hypothetical protein